MSFLGGHVHLVIHGDMARRTRIDGKKLRQLQVLLEKEFPYATVNVSAPVEIKLGPGFVVHVCTAMPVTHDERGSLRSKIAKVLQPTRSYIHFLEDNH